MNGFADRRSWPLGLSASWLRGIACIGALISFLPTRVPAQTNDFDLRWGGNVFDAFTIDGSEVWTVEDGGRIRHRDTAGTWTFQTVPSTVKDTIHRVFFLPGTSGAQTGWAVAADGSVLKTFNSGSSWNRVAQFGAILSGTADFEVLYAVHFIDADHGWIAGLHGIWYTDEGGDNPGEWHQATLRHPGGQPFNATELGEIELYELDAVVDTNPPVGLVGTPILGLASAEPGLVFRSKNGRDWEVVWDLHDHCAEVATTCAVNVCNLHDLDIWEPWDIEISRNPSQKLALMCGGIVFQCGLIWRSTDDGSTWVREQHECDPCFSGGSCPCSFQPTGNYLDETGPAIGSGDTNLYRFSRMRTIYNLDIFDADNSALAVGYNGQVLWRNPSTQIWEDRSSFSPNYLTVTNAHVAALFGVSTDGVAAPNGKAIATGVGGTIFRSINGGQSWDTGSSIKGEPYRSHDVDFQSATDGWMVGQFSRIATSPDGAATWSERSPLPNYLAPPLHAVAFADTQRGVAVGGNSGSSGNPEGAPKMLYNTLAPTQPWTDVSSSLQLSTSPPGTFGSLKDVVYVPGTSIVWAAGDKGFVVRAGQNGASLWRQILINGAQIADFEINGITFKDAYTGLFVGRMVSTNLATVYQLKVDAQGAFSWTSLTVNPISSTAPVSDIGDIAVVGSDAYAVGETLETPSPGVEIRKGIVLKASYVGSASTGSFQNFQPFTPTQVFPKCQVGGNLRGGEATTGSTIPVLNRIAIAPNGHIWVGGECGRVWKYDSSTWTEFKSQTDTNLLGISFPTSTEGFFVGYRFVETSQALVRYQ